MTAASNKDLQREIARLLAGRTAAALAMAGQTYRIEVRPGEAFDELIRVLEPWVERNVYVPASDAACGEDDDTLARRRSPPDP
jgi:hypothetical protein